MHKKLYVLITIVLLLALVVCGKKEVGRDEKEIETKKSNYNLNWGKFENNLVTQKINNSELINELDVLILYFGLKNEPYDANEFANYSPEYKNAENEFERRKIGQAVVQVLEQRKQELLSKTLCVKADDIRIGEYDFNRKGFPLIVKDWGGDKEKMRSFISYTDNSKSGNDILGTINLMARGGRRYKAVNSTIDFDNINDKSIFPSFIPVNESTAEKIIGEFKVREDQLEKTAAKSFGKTYKGYKTTNVYIIFKPTHSETGRGIQEGVKYDIKEVHGNGFFVVFATEKGTVFGVYPKIKVGQETDKNVKDDIIEVQCVDIDGNNYKTVQIGSQCWMAENLKVTHYRDGTPIPNVTTSDTWSGLTTGAYCNYDNDPSHVHTYGRLYNWYAIDDARNIAPLGWHVPSKREWKILVDYYDGSSVAGKKLKEAGTTHWSNPNPETTSENVFTALPSGYRNHSNGDYNSIGDNAYFWTSTEENNSHAWDRCLNHKDSRISSNNDNKQLGFSVRCVKD